MVSILGEQNATSQAHVQVKCISVIMCKCESSSLIQPRSLNDASSIIVRSALIVRFRGDPSLCACGTKGQVRSAPDVCVCVCACVYL